MIYIDVADRSPLGDNVSEDGMLPGELAFFASGGGMRRATGADSRVDGVIADLADDHIAEHDEDFRSGLDQFTYDSSNGDRAQAGGGEDHARLRCRTPVDGGDGDPAPTIQGWSVVGIPDRTGMEGRIVEEGYTDGQSTPVTYNRSNGNFNPVGLAMMSDSKTHGSGMSEYDGLVHVLRRVDL